METVASPIKENAITRLYVYVEHKKYEFLLFSFLLLIFGNTFTDNVKTAGVLDIYQNMIIGSLVFYSRKPVRNILFVLILLSLGLDLLQDSFTIPDTRTWHSIIYLGFFFI